MSREQMEFDVLIVGGGPAGLAAAIRVKQLANESGDELSVCVIEKGSEIGAHILSGAVMDPRALGELFPNPNFDPPLSASACHIGTFRRGEVQLLGTGRIQAEQGEGLGLKRGGLRGEDDLGLGVEVSVGTL